MPPPQEIDRLRKGRALLSTLSVFFARTKDTVKTLCPAHYGQTSDHVTVALTRLTAVVSKLALARSDVNTLLRLLGASAPPLDDDRLDEGQLLSPSLTSFADCERQFYWMVYINSRDMVEVIEQLLACFSS